jgi:hypothetical protein
MREASIKEVAVQPVEVLAEELTGRSAVASSQRPAPSHIIFEGRVGA